MTRTGSSGNPDQPVSTEATAATSGDESGNSKKTLDAVDLQTIEDDDTSLELLGHEKRTINYLVNE